MKKDILKILITHQLTKANQPDATSQAIALNLDSDTEFSIDLPFSGKKPPISVKSITGDIHLDTLRIRNIEFSFNSAAFLKSIKSYLKQQCNLIVDNAELLNAADSAHRYLILALNQNSSHHLIIGIQLQLSKLADAINIHCKDFLILNDEANVALIHVINAIKQALHSDRSAGEKPGLTTTITSIHDLVIRDLSEHLGKDQELERRLQIESSTAEISVDAKKLKVSLDQGALETMLCQQQYPHLLATDISANQLAETRAKVAENLLQDHQHAFMQLACILTGVRYLGVLTPGSLTELTRKQADSHLSPHERLQALDQIIIYFEQNNFPIDESALASEYLALAYADNWLELDFEKTANSIQKSLSKTPLNQRISTRILALNSKYPRIDISQWFRNIYNGPAQDATYNLLMARLAQGQLTTDPANAYQLTLETIESNQDNFEVLNTAITNLKKMGKWQEAINLATALMENRRFSNHHLELKLTLAELYFFGLNEAELAQTIIAECLSIKGYFHRANALAKAILLRSGDTNRLLDALFQEWQMCEGHPTTELINETLTALKRPNTNHRVKLGLYICNSSQFPLSADYILSQVEHEQVFEQPKELVAAIGSNIAKEASPINKAKLHVALATFYKKSKYRHRKLELENLQCALRLGWIDENNITNLQRIYTKEGKLAELYELLVLKLKNAVGEQRQKTLKEILNLELSLPEDETFKFLYELVDSFSDSHLLVKHLKFLAQSEQIELAVKLASRALASQANTKAKNSILKQIIPLIKKENRLDQDKLLDKVFSAASDKDFISALDLANEALTHFNFDHDPVLYASYIITSLSHDQLPNVGQLSVEDALCEHPYDLGNYYYLKAQNTSNKIDAINFAEKALELASKSPASDERTLQIFKLLSSLRLLSPSEIVSLKELAVSPNYYKKSLEIIHEQLEKEPKPENRIRLLRNIIEIEFQAKKDSDVIITYFQKLVSYSECPLAYRIEYIYFLQSQMRSLEEEEALRNILPYLHQHSDSNDVIVLAERLYYEFGRREEVIEGVKTQLEYAISQMNMDAGVQLSMFLIDLGIHDSRSISLGVQAALSTGTLNQISMLLLNVFNNDLSPTEVANTLLSIQKQVSSHSVTTSFEDLLAIISEKFSSISLNDESRAYLVRTIIHKLHRRDQFSSHLISMYEHLSADDIKKDEYLWLPLYQLLRDYGTPESLNQLLCVIVPMLQENPRLLDSTPYTIESMMAEMNTSNVHESQTISALSSLEIENLEQNERERTGSANVTHEPSEDLRSASPVTAHVAAQISFLTTGSASALKASPWPIWRRAPSIGYDLNGKARLVQVPEVGENITNWHALLLKNSKSIANYFRENYKLERIANDLKLESSDINSISRPIPWKDILFQRSSLNLLTEKISKRKLTFHDLDGLGKRLLHSVETQQVFLDRNYYLSQPSSHIFHRIGFLYLTLRSGNWVFMHLDPVKDVLPFIKRLKDEAAASPVVRQAKALTLSLVDVKSSQIAAIIQNSGAETINQLPKLNKTQVIDLYSYIKRQLYYRLLADTLDLVGLCETITDEDLLSLSAEKIEEVLSKHEYAKDLIELAKSLNLD